MKLSKDWADCPLFQILIPRCKKPNPMWFPLILIPDTHADYVRKSLNANAHVFVEKPLATTVEEARELVELALQKIKKWL